VFTGDFFCAPPRAVPDLEAAPAELTAGDVATTAARFFAARHSCYP
jgi:hypothetical protein